MKNCYTFILALLLGSQSFAQVSIGNGTSTSNGMGPINAFYEYSYYQTIYKASDINATGAITSIQYEMSNSNPINNTDEQIDVWVGHTTKNAFVDGHDWIQTSEMTKVLTSGTAVKSGTTVTITFETPFEYNGVDNLVIAIDANEPGYDTGGDQFYYTDDPNQDRVNIHYRGDDFNPDPNDTDAIQSSIFTTYSYPNIVINGISQSCPKPTDVMTTNITGTSVDISWNQTGSATNWTIEYGEPGFTPGNGTMVNVDSGSPYTLSGLTATTNYEFYIKANCGAGDSSFNAGPYSFTTACATIMGEFETDLSVYPPNCWSIANGAMGENLQFGASKWRDDRSFMSADNDVIESNAVNLYTNTQRTWLISNNFDLSNNDYSLETLVALTKYSFSGLSTHGDTATMGSDDKVYLLISTDNGMTWTDLATWDVNNQPAVSGDEMTFDLSAYDGEVKFAFYATDGEIDNEEDYDFHVGKFKITTTNSMAVEDVATNKSKYDFYPNPVNDILIIKGEKNVGKVSVYDVAGQLVYQNEFSRDTANIDLRSLATGHYVVNAEIDGVMQNFKIVKK